MKQQRILVLFLFLFTIAGLGCRQNETIIEGDLYFSWLRIGSFYNEPDSIAEKMLLYADTVNIDKLDSPSRRTMNMYEVLKKEHLLYSPFVNLKLDNDSIILLYLDKKGYDKIRISSYKSLVNSNQKIRVRLSAQSLQYQMYLCRSIIAVNKIEGKTFMQSRKLLIEDYQ